MMSKTTKTLFRYFLAFGVIAVCNIYANQNKVGNSNFALKSDSESTDKQKYNELPLNVIMLGHVNHGKTTLTAAITKVMAKEGLTEFRDFESIDAAPEENVGRITINTAHVECYSDKRRYSIVDAPGNADIIKYMIAHGNTIDAAILVVDATDGPMPQTREHIELAHKIHIPEIIVFLNKIDLIDDPEIIELVEEEVRELLDFNQYDEEKTPVIRGSALGALDGDSKWEPQIINLMNNMDSCFYLPENKRDKAFLMPIEDVFNITGRGTVVSGKIETGIITRGDELEIVGLGANKRKTSCKGVEMFRKITNKAEAGDQPGVFLEGVEVRDIKRGMVIAEPGTVSPHTKFKAEIYILKKEEGGRHTPFHDKYKPQFYLRTCDIKGEIIFPEGTDVVMPGDNLSVNVELIEPVVLNPGLRFTILEAGRTVGMGIITDIKE